jgi:hypothetical protein
MQNPHRARVSERHFLNLPGYHAGAYVRAYVEDTSALPSEYDERALNHFPQIDLEIADCVRRISLEFDITSAGDRMNSFHKVDTLIAALQALRQGMAEEAALYRARAAAVEVDRRAREEAKKRRAATRRRPARRA